MFLGQNDNKGSNPLEIAAFIFGCLKPIWDRFLFYIPKEEQSVAIIIFSLNLDTLVLLVLKNMLLFFDE
ncbi:hypothetical protein Pse7429DRAFT_0017 [Pseudanabaena biceps PCC 7429]|uniref:Uncharacterized protein n=1 Tax=Pseudanabaena biceps PCC 7429 TaxID=927668 RepID=L8N9D5_9CYAN|nr:hypothetical protein Pse7429DRAFT_0017 [Pseudanabaena biceps PCC 7429]